MNSDGDKRNQVAALTHEVVDAQGRKEDGCPEAIERGSELPLTMKPTELAIMTTGLGKAITIVRDNSNLASMNDVAKFIAQYQLAELESQNLANLVNGLSPAINEPYCQQAAFGALDQIILHLLQNNLEYFEPPHLAKLIHGLRQIIGGSLCEEVLGKELNSHATLFSQGYLDLFNPQQRADLVIHHIALYILRRDLAHVEPQLLAKLLYRLSQLVVNLNSISNSDSISSSFDSDSNSDFVKNIHFVSNSVSINSISDTDSNFDFVKNTHFVSNSVSSGNSDLVSNPDFDCKFVLKAIDSFAVHLSQSDLKNFGARSLKILAHGFDMAAGALSTDLELQPSPTLVKNQVAKYISQRDLANFEPHQLAGLFCRFSRVFRGACFNGSYMLGALDHIAVYLLRCDLEQFAPEQLINLAHSLHEMLKTLRSEGMQGAMENIYGLSSESLLATSKPKQLVQSVTNLIARYIFRRNLADFKPQQLIDLLNGSCKVLKKFHYTLVISALNHIVVQLSNRDLSKFDQLQLAELAKALHNVARNLFRPESKAMDPNIKPEPDSADPKPQQLDNLVRQLIIRYILQSNLANFGLQQLASLVHSFNKMDKSSDCWEVIEAMDRIMIHLLQRDLADALTVPNRRAFTNLFPEIREASLSFLPDCQSAPGSPYSPIYDPEPISQDGLIQPGKQPLPFVDSIARYISQRNLANFTSQQLVNLAYTFSQLLTSLACASCQATENFYFGCQYLFRAMDCLAVQLSQRDLTTFEPQHLTSLACSFLKLAENPDFNQRIRPTNNLAKVAPKRNLAVPVELADQVLYNLGAYILQRNLANFKMKPLIHLMEGFSRLVKTLPHPPVAEILDHIVLQLLQHDSGDINLLNVEYISRRDLAGFDLRQLAKLAIGLSKRVSELACRKPALEILDHIMVYISQHDVVKDGGSATRSNPDPELSTFANLVYGLNSVLNALGYIAENEAISQDNLLPLDQEQLASLVVNHIVTYVLQRDLANFEPGQLAHLAKVFDRIFEDSQHQRVLRAINRIAERILNCDSVDFCTPAMASLFYEFSKWARMPDCKQVLDALDYIADCTLRNNLEIREPQQLVDLVNGFSTLLQISSLNRRSIFVTTTAAAKHIQKRRDWAGFKPQQLADLVNALSEVAVIFPDQDVYAAVDQVAFNIKVVMKKVNQLLKKAKPIPRGCLTDFDAQTLANLVQGLNKAAKISSCKYVLKALDCVAKHVLRRNLAEFDLKQLTHLSHAVNKVFQQCRGANMQAAVDCIDQQLLQKTEADTDNAPYLQKWATDLAQKLASSEQQGGHVHNSVVSRTRKRSELPTFISYLEDPIG